MSPVYCRRVLCAGSEIVFQLWRAWLTLGAASSYAQRPAGNDISEAVTGNSGGGTGALNSTSGANNTAYGSAARGQESVLGCHQGRLGVHLGRASLSREPPGSAPTLVRFSGFSPKHLQRLEVPP